MTNAIAKRESESRGIQRRHVRRVLTKQGPRDVLVNPAVRKDLKRPVHGNQISQIREPKQLPMKQRAAPAVKLRWQAVLKTDKPSEFTLLKKKIEKEMEMRGIKLREGEHVAIKVLKMGLPIFGSVSGSITLLDKDDGPVELFMEYSMRSRNFNMYLNDKFKKGEPVIYWRDEEGGMSGVIGGAREFEHITLRENAIDKDPADKSSDMTTLTPLHDGTDRVVAKTRGKDGKMLKRTFASFEKAMEMQDKLGKEGRDIFGKRVHPQTRLPEFRGPK